MFFATPAYAQAAGGSGAGFGFEMFIPLALIFVIMYFLIIRPQRAQMKQRQEMLNAVRRGDTVVTGGGIVGRVTKVFDESGEVEVEIADGIRIRALRSTLADIRSKGTDTTSESTAAITRTKKPATRKKTAAANKNSEDSEAK